MGLIRRAGLHRVHLSFGVEFDPGKQVPRIVVDRTFSWTSDDGDAWSALRWARGRPNLTGIESLGPGWGWHTAPVSEWDGLIHIGSDR